MAALKPQDIVLALKLVATAGRPWTQPDLARSIFMSASEVNHGLRRLAVSRLFNQDERRVARANLLEFLLHGLRYVFPAELGVFAEGMPTGHSAKPLVDKLRSGTADGLVWVVEDASGHRVKGHAIEPLYRSAPRAAAQDRSLHELLALADALRVGRARERTLAAEELSRRLELS